MIDEKLLTDHSLLEIESLSKSFAGIKALDEASLSIRPGEVLGLLGANGSGKSTLIKVLAGFHKPDGGTIRLGGEEVGLGGHSNAKQQARLGFVHQELGLYSELSVAENLYLYDIAAYKSLTPFSLSAKIKRAKEDLREFGLAIDASKQVKAVTPAERAQIAVLRAYLRLQAADIKSGVLILDEPTVFLPYQERRKLFELIRNLTSRGFGVLMVSHDLSDVRAVGDRVTVLRNGRTVATMDVAQVSNEEIIRSMLGTGADNLSSSPTRHDNFDVLSRPTKSNLAVECLSGGNLRNVSFTVNRGEIVGFAGVSGSGYEDLVYLLYGARQGKGWLTIGGESFDLRRMSPSKAIRMGMILIPAERGSQSAIRQLSVSENVAMSVLKDVTTRGLISRLKIRDNFRRVASRLGVVPNDASALLSSLSGGNQQKVVVGKWLQTQPGVMLIHEPTQGIDVGASADLIDLMRESCSNGASILWVSEDHQVLAKVCDRVIVFRDGIVTSILEKPFADEEITSACFKIIDEN